MGRVQPLQESARPRRGHCWILIYIEVHIQILARTARTLDSVCLLHAHSPPRPVHPSIHPSIHPSLPPLSRPDVCTRLHRFAQTLIYCLPLPTPVHDPVVHNTLLTESSSHHRRRHRQLLQCHGLLGSFGSPTCSSSPVAIPVSWPFSFSSPLFHVHRNPNHTHQPRVLLPHQRMKAAETSASDVRCAEHPLSPTANKILRARRQAHRSSCIACVLPASGSGGRDKVGAPYLFPLDLKSKGETFAIEGCSAV
ncbi:hypothetical protein B0H63DRAFT_246325 [Podospora didyma]|uniref:Uncharacterized protein n=1 Tax=Podospora didyma TaxID=330526 RepID=A0AAE0KLM3_9PEZI|nr:hypothetical protein B0H63DRAFT_246325 [Podospora didyma]